MERLFFVKDAPSADPPVSTEQITSSPAFYAIEQRIDLHRNKAY